MKSRSFGFCQVSFSFTPLRSSSRTAAWYAAARPSTSPSASRITRSYISSALRTAVMLL